MTTSSMASTVVGLAGLAAAGLLGGRRSPASRSRARSWPGRPALSATAPVPRGRRRRRPRDRDHDSARWARPADLRSLRVGGTGIRRGQGKRSDGRLVLGWSGKRLLAGEPRQSVIVFGPTQSRKTSGFAVPSILEWEGPVIATSVKADLVGDTIAHRRRGGEVACFDPTGSTGLPSTRWSPLPAARTWPGARRVASAMTDTGRTSVGTMTDGDFWYATATKMLAPLLFAAASAGLSMADVVRWVDTQEESEVVQLLDATDVAEAIAAARALFSKEERQRSSIYTTVETILEPFGAEGVDGLGGESPDIDPGGLVAGPNTLYLCAPAHDQRRLSPLFTAVLRQVLEHVFDTVTRTGSPLDPPLLVVLDEAANIAPLADLDALAATAAGHGIQLVTIWHDLAQITARYGPRSATVVNNHRAKVFLSGISDPSTLDYASHLIGEEEVLLPAFTSGGQGGPTTTRSPTNRRLAPPHALRRIPPGEGVLVYGGLPPAWLGLRTYFDDPVLARRAAGQRDNSGTSMAVDRARRST